MTKAGFDGTMADSMTIRIPLTKIERIVKDRHAIAAKTRESARYAADPNCWRLTIRAGYRK